MLGTFVRSALWSAEVLPQSFGLDLSNSTRIDSHLE